MRTKAEKPKRYTKPSQATVTVDGVQYLSRRQAQTYYNIGTSTFTLKTRKAGIKGHRVTSSNALYYTVEECEIIARTGNYNSRQATALSEHLDIIERQTKRILERLERVQTGQYHTDSELSRITDKYTQADKLVKALKNKTQNNE